MGTGAPSGLRGATGELGAGRGGAGAALGSLGGPGANVRLSASFPAAVGRGTPPGHLRSPFCRLPSPPPPSPAQEVELLSTPPAAAPPAGSVPRFLA